MEIQVLALVELSSHIHKGTITHVSVSAVKALLQFHAHAGSFVLAEESWSCKSADFSAFGDEAQRKRGWSF